MARILYGNFDFEHELEDRSYRPSARIAALTARLVPHLIALAADGDYLWDAAEISREFLDAAARAGLPEVHRSGSQPAGLTTSGGFSESLVSEHWGWSAASVRVAEQQKWKTACPEFTAVAQVNDRVFAAGLEAESECGLPGSRLIRSTDELLRTIRMAANRLDIDADEFQWVAKSRFGMASRGRIRGTGTLLSKPSSGWLAGQFRKNTEIVFEPWVTCDREFSTQWVIPCRDGAPGLLGWTDLLTGPDGTPCGWNIRPGMPFEGSEFCSALPVLTATVHRIAAAGYFGPVGIDSMRYVCPDTHQTAAVTTNGLSNPIRPLQDINGRYTMGRVALELAARLCPEADASWLQLPAAGLCQAVNVESQRQANELYSRQGLEISKSLSVIDGQTVLLPDGIRVWLTSPLWSGDVPATHCGLLVAGPGSPRMADFFRKKFAGT